MARDDFYDIKGLGELPTDDEAEHPTLPNQPARPYKLPKGKKPWRTVLLVVLLVVVIAALGGGAYWFSKDHKSKNTTSSKQPNKTVVTPATTSSNGMTTYVSKGSDLNLSFSYPSDWSVTPASGGNTNDQTISVTSPLTSFPIAGASDATGKVMVTIRPGSASLTELGANTPTAAVASSQIAYTAPTANQYQYPYLTFIHFTNGVSTASAFEEVLITGTMTYTQGQAISAGDLSGLDPIIAVTFNKCSTTACSGSGATPTAITSDTWTNTTLFQQTQTVFTSLKLN